MNTDQVAQRLDSLSKLGTAGMALLLLGGYLAMQVYFDRERDMYERTRDVEQAARIDELANRQALALEQSNELTRLRNEIAALQMQEIQQDTAQRKAQVKVMEEQNKILTGILEQLKQAR